MRRLASRAPKHTKMFNSLAYRARTTAPNATATAATSDTDEALLGDEVPDGAGVVTVPEVVVVVVDDELLLVVVVGGVVMTTAAPVVPPATTTVDTLSTVMVSLDTNAYTLLVVDSQLVLDSAVCAELMSCAAVLFEPESTAKSMMSEPTDRCRMTT